MSGGKDLSAEKQKRLLLVVACALLDADGRVLIAQRPEGKSMAGLWELPKIQARPILKIWIVKGNA